MDSFRPLGNATTVSRPPRRLGSMAVSKQHPLELEKYPLVIYSFAAPFNFQLTDNPKISTNLGPLDLARIVAGVRVQGPVDDKLVLGLQYRKPVRQLWIRVDIHAVPHPVK